jgi:hypothetical protein
MVSWDCLFCKQQICVAAVNAIIIVRVFFKPKICCKEVSENDFHQWFGRGPFLRCVYMAKTRAFFFFLSFCCCDGGGGFVYGSSLWYNARFEDEALHFC